MVLNYSVMFKNDNWLMKLNNLGFISSGTTAAAADAVQQIRDFYRKRKMSDFFHEMNFATFPSRLFRLAFFTMAAALLHFCLARLIQGV